MRRCLYPWISIVPVAAVAGAMVSLGLAANSSPAAAESAPVRAAAPAADQTALLAEDLELLKALAPLGLSRSQLSQLLPALRGAQARLAEFDARESEKLAAFRGALEQAKRDLLSGKGTAARAHEQFTTAVTASAGRRAGLRAELVAGLRRTLDTALSPQQMTLLTQNGQTVLFTQRSASWRGGSVGPGSGGPAGGPPGGGGPGSRMADRLDRFRQMSPAEFQQEADRMAGRMGGQNSPQFQQFLSQMNTIRNMPHSQYLLQRDQLATQLMGRGAMGGALAGSNDGATNAFVDRYLLSPRAPQVIADRLGAASSRE
jgi:hypothetical protein